MLQESVAGWFRGFLDDITCRAEHQRTKTLDLEPMLLLLHFGAYPSHLGFQQQQQQQQRKETALFSAFSSRYCLSLPAIYSLPFRSFFQYPTVDPAEIRLGWELLRYDASEDR